MGNWYDDEDSDDFQAAYNSAPKQLREAYDAIKGKLTKLDTDFKTLKQESGKRVLADVLQEKGLDPEVGEFLVQAGIDPSDMKAVDGWLATKGRLFGYTPDSPEGQGAPDERAAAAAKMQNAQAGAIQNESISAELERRMDDAKTPEDVTAVLDDWKRLQAS